MGHMRRGLRGFMVASTGVKAPFASGGQRRSTAIRITGGGAA